MPTASLFDLLLFVLASFGLTFGLMQKLPRPVYFDADGEFRKGFFGRLLRCSYCTGFHAGWMSWLLLRFSGVWPEFPWPSIVVFAFVGAASGYLLDTASSYWEAQSGE